MAGIKIFIVAMAIVAAGIPSPASGIEPRDLAAELLAEPLERLPVKKGVAGIASYYAKRFNGRKTNSGEVHDPDALVAAHPTLPLGTRVVVRNLANDQEVVVTVNDRCRKKKIPFIDLSREAARRLGFLGRGTARVKMFPVLEKRKETLVAVR